MPAPWPAWRTSGTQRRTYSNDFIRKRYVIQISLNLSQILCSSYHSSVPLCVKLGHSHTQKQLDPDFGDGLPESDVDKIREGSEEFWGLLKGIQNEDVQSLSDEEGVAAQNIISEVARLDEDLDNPDRKDSVMPEYRHLESELSDVDW